MKKVDTFLVGQLFQLCYLSIKERYYIQEEKKHHDSTLMLLCHTLSEQTTLNLSIHVASVPGFPLTIIHRVNCMGVNLALIFSSSRSIKMHKGRACLELKLQFNYNSY